MRLMVMAKSSGRWFGFRSRIACSARGAALKLLRGVWARPNPSLYAHDWLGRGNLEENGGAAPFAHCLWETPSRRSEEHTSELQSLMRISYAVFCLKKKNTITTIKSLYKDNNNTRIYMTLLE